MDTWRYVFRSVLHYRTAYLGVLAGAVLGATVLLGALFAGDSVEASLRQLAAHRTGRATHLLTGGDRFFRAALAQDLSAGGAGETAPVLYLRGTAVNARTQGAAGQVQLVGVTDAFWSLAPHPPGLSLAAGGPALAVNRPLARRLGIEAGDTVIVRVQQPGVLAGDAPIAGAESRLETVRGPVAAVVDEAGFGHFSLESTQVPPPTVFLPIARLQEALDQPDRANLLLVRTAESAADLRRRVAERVQLADYGLKLEWREAAGAFDLTSARIFLDPEIARAVIRAIPAAQPVVSYLINEFAHGDRTTPYSIAAATTPPAAPFLPPDLGPRELVINSWLAEDLDARAGDELRLTYYRAGETGALVEDRAAFRVRAIVPLEGLAADRAWMPEFPGISDAQRQGDWDSGLPLDLDRIRDKDEQYWNQHRGTPKAFLSLEAGAELWSTRWGEYTALRLPFPREREAELAATVRAALQPEMNQLLVQGFGADAAQAGRSPVDFAGLFIGMSFFLIAAALGLVAMLFQFALHQRNREDALLGAVGVSGRRLLRWRMAEAGVLLLLAGAAGAGLAMLYTRGILRFLESIWAGETAGTRFVFSAQPASIATGAVIFVALSLLAMWLAIRRQARRALSIRLAAHMEEIAAPAGVRRSSLRFAAGAGLVAVLALAASERVLPAQGAFYVAGFALLATGIALCRWWMARGTAGGTAGAHVDPRGLGTSNLKARRSRSLTVVGAIATAVFMVLSVASFRKQVGDDWLERRSGTGGFAFWIETTVPLNPARDPSLPGFEAFASESSRLGEVVPLRAGVGDNANCFNLNTVAQPRLLAVDAGRLASRHAFPLNLPNGEGERGWNALRRPTPAGALPAFVDATTLQWALKRKVGDVLPYVDENGRPFDVEIIGTIADSVFQGYLVVDEALFLEKFPSHGGYSIFLADAREPGAIAELRPRLERNLRDAGGRVELTRDVLAAFHRIENTYIGIFNVLGSLGVILGSLGLAIVVARNLHERRGEFAVMHAMGIPRRILARIVFAEFGLLVACGLLVGTTASAVAVWPNLGALPAAPTLLLVGGLLAGIAALNLASGWAVFRWSVRALRPGMEQAAM